MALRKYHLLWGFIAYLIYLVSYWYILENNVLPDIVLPDIDPIWIMTGLLLCLVGAELADYDQLTGLLSHRDIITHSGLIPTIIFLIFLISKILGIADSTLVYAVSFTPFMIGYATHMWLDLFPTINPEKTLKQKGIAEASMQLFGAVIQGLTAAEIISRVGGTYLIHLPTKLPVINDGSNKDDKFIVYRKTFPKHWTRWWLLFSGIYCLLLGFLTFNLYTDIVPSLSF